MKRRTAIKTLGVFPFMGTCLNAKEETIENNSRAVEKVIETDILVVGGGTAGTVAAIQASRAGCKTILLECGNQLGGTMTTGGVSFPGLFHAWGKQIIGGIGWELVSETVALNSGKLPDFKIPFGRRHPKHQIYLNGPLYALLAEEKCVQCGVFIRYYETPVQVCFKDQRWFVDVVGKGTACQIVCQQIIDCTGNALVASMAGYKLQREKDVQPGSLIFELGGYDLDRLDKKILAERFKKAISEGSLLKKDAYGGVWGLLTVKNGLATQHVLHADSTTSELHTKTNIEGRASMLRIIRFIRSLPGCENAYFKKLQSEVAIRETNRIDGIYQITHQDYIEGRVFDDSLAYSYYPIDLHVEEGVKPKHLSDGKVATIPFRSLIPKGSTNLLVAGRCVSSDRLANSALRVQASCMAMGQVAGCAAVLACMENKPLLDLSIPELKNLIRKYKGIVPGE